MTTSIFDATPSLLGYIYQIRYALFVALDKAHNLPDTDNCTVTLETIEDVSVENKSAATDLIQTKYHLKPGNLSDKSSNIWGTIRSWCEKNTLDLYSISNTPVFTLLTTEHAKPNSLAELLSSDTTKRDEFEAIKIMNKIASDGGNKANDGGYKAFLALDPLEQHELVSCIYVICNAPNIQEVEKKIISQLRLSVPSECLTMFTSRVEGIWFKWCIDAMIKQGPNSIALTDLVTEIQAISREYSPTVLPTEYEDFDTDDFYENEKNKHYVKQLNILRVKPITIKSAIKNCVKARRQRSSWHRQGLLLPGELNKYEKKLFDEWELNFGDVVSFNSSDDSVTQGGIIYQRCQADGLKKIRKNLDADFVARGSYHMLANENRIGWHPDFESLIAFRSDKKLDGHDE